MSRRSNGRVMLKLAGLVRPLSGYMALAIAMGLIGNLCAAFVTIFAGYGVLAALGIGSLSMAAALGLAAVCALVRGGLRYGEQACNHFIAFKLLAHIRDKVFGALRRLCPAKLEGRDRGDLIALITSDIELLEVFYAHTISPAAIAALFTAVMVVYIGHFHALLGLLALIAYVTVGVLLPLAASKRSGQDGANLRRQSGEMSSFVLESLRGLGEILQFGAGESRLAEMNRRTDDLAQTEEEMKRTAGASSAVTNAVVLLFDFAMLLAAGLLYSAGKIGFDGLLLATLAQLSSFGPTVALSALGTTLQSTLAAGNRVLDILEEAPQTPDIVGQKAVSYDGAAAEHVTFGYGGETVLRDFSVEIGKTGITGIVGRSGSGKSTLLRLLMRFWQVDSGRVAISDTSVEAINTDNLRDMESFVEQETHLFHDSIAANLRIAKADATQEELEAACQKASVHDFILSLPKGYDTPVGELGDTLSGGEKQRLGLARAFLHDAPLMLLDEPTSNLDSLNEAVILRALRREKDKRAIVLVSHRPSTMATADKVYTAEQGRVS